MSQATASQLLCTCTCLCQVVFACCISHGKNPLMQVKAMELYDALESSGSYSKAEITERVDKYRDKLMQVNDTTCVVQP